MKVNKKCEHAGKSCKKKFGKKELTKRSATSSLTVLRAHEREQIVTPTQIKITKLRFGALGGVLLTNGSPHATQANRIVKHNINVESSNGGGKAKRTCTPYPCGGLFSFLILLLICCFFLDIEIVALLANQLVGGMHGGSGALSIR